MLQLYVCNTCPKVFKQVYYDIWSQICLLLAGPLWYGKQSHCLYVSENPESFVLIDEAYLIFQQ